MARGIIKSKTYVKSMGREELISFCMQLQQEILIYRKAVNDCRNVLGNLYIIRDINNGKV